MTKVAASRQRVNMLSLSSDQTGKMPKLICVFTGNKDHPAVCFHAISHIDIAPAV